MPVQDAMGSLTAVAASNSPAGSDSISNTLDDYLRSIQAILRHTEAQGAALTSTASMSLAAATGAYVHVTAADAITHLGTAVAGIERVLVFDDAATLTNSANIILPGGNNITAAAGDCAVFRSEGSGVWRCISYQQADGTAIVSNALGTTFSNITVLSSASISALVVMGTATISALAVLGTATISTLAVLGRASISALTVPGAASISALTVTGPATFTTIEVLKTAVFDAEVAAGSFTATGTIAWASGNKQRVTLKGAATFVFTDPPGGCCNLVLRLLQDGTGGYNPAWPASVKWAGGTEPSWSTGASAIDIVSFYWDGSAYYGVGAIGFG
jgi:hypothetical protein